MLDVEYRAIQEKVKQGQIIRDKISGLKEALLIIESGQSAIVTLYSIHCQRIEYLGESSQNSTRNGFTGKDMLALIKQAVIPEIQKRIAALEAEFAAL